MTRTILIASGKGGVGRTALAAALSCALAAQGRRVLAMDLCAGTGALDLALGMQDRALFSVSDLLAGERSVEDSPAPVRGYPSLQMLSAPAPGVRIVPGELLAFCRDMLRREVDVVMDCDAGLSDSFFAALPAAELVLAVTTPEAASLRNLCWLSRELAVHDRLEARLVVNRLPCERRELRALSPNIDAYMDETGLPLGGVIREDPAVRITAMQGIPLLSGEKSTAAKEISTMAERILREEF